VFIIYLVKFSFLFFLFYLFATDCVFSVNKDYHNFGNSYSFADGFSVDRKWDISLNSVSEILTPPSHHQFIIIHTENNPEALLHVFRYSLAARDLQLVWEIYVLGLWNQRDFVHRLLQLNMLPCCCCLLTH